MQMVLPLRRKRIDDGPALHPVPAIEGVVPDDGVASAPPADGRAEAHASVEPAQPAPEQMAVTVQRIELGSLASVALRTALVVTTIGALAVLAVWTLADVGGLVDRFEAFMRSIGVRGFHLSSGDVLAGLVILVAGLALTAATLAVVAGAAYNLLAATGGGIRVRIGPAAAPSAAEAPEAVADDAAATAPVPIGVMPHPIPDPAA